MARTLACRRRGRRDAVHEAVIIHPPERTSGSNGIQLSARVEIQTQGVGLPDRLWFRVDKEVEEFLVDHGDPFIMALLPIAMRLQEDVVVEPSVSPRLAYGLEQYQHILHTWWGDYFPIVDIRYEQLEVRRPEASRGAVGVLFSNGVDSFHTLWRHLPRNEPLPAYRLTHAVMINGFHNYLDFDETGLIPKLRRVNQPMFDRLGLEFLVVATNAGDFSRPVHHRFTGYRTYVSRLICVPLALAKLFSRFFVAGGDYYGGEDARAGSHPLTDFLLSTEAFETVHDGAGFPRSEKIDEIAHWPEVYPLMHPCFRTPTFNEEVTILENCCRCEKCMRTETALEIVGALENYTAFPRPFKRWSVSMPWYIDDGSRYLVQENIQLARKYGRRDIVRRLRIGLWGSWMLSKLANWGVRRRATRPLPWQDGRDSPPSTAP